MQFHNVLFKTDNFTLIVSAITALVFDLGMSLGKAEVRKRSGNL